MRLEVITSLDEIQAAEWNQLNTGRHPFTRHEFLAALEHHHCVSGRQGWQSCHLLLHDTHGGLRGAMPLYLKSHSRGEFVFDWSWAEAFHDHGLAYYPKLVAAIPFTPVPGPRLLVRPGDEAAVSALIQGSRNFAVRTDVSSIHWLFPHCADQDRLKSHDLLLRKDLRFVWRNAGYRDFDDYLDAFTSGKRKKIRRERKRIEEQGLVMQTLHGDEITAGLWDQLYPLYTSTYYLRGQQPYLTQAFFEEICRCLGRDVVLFIARNDHAPVACAITLRDEHSLYGRHWGSTADYHSLHFEACYYQPLEYCIREGLQHFDPGTQGAHKLSRGFLPEATWSAHWIAHGGFRQAIADFLQRETAMIDQHMQELAAHSPFRRQG